MAKQKGLAKFAGKIDEQSFYYSKNGGYQSRKINPGMSSRVKTAPEYANTRLNNAEFGGAGSCAGAMVSGISSRWRFILDSIATGKLVNRIKAAMLLDTTSVWGKRKLQVADMPSIQEYFNRLSKNPMNDSIKTQIISNALYKSSTMTIMLEDDIMISKDYENELVSKGANGIISKVYCYSVNTPTPLLNENKYKACVSSIESYDSAGVDLPLPTSSDAILINSGQHDFAHAAQNDSLNFGGMLVVLLPYKQVGSQQYILQELCSAGWYSLANYQGS